MANQNRRDETAVRIGQAIRAARERLGITQQDLANRLQVKRTTVAGWESGRRLPDVASIEGVAGVLGMPVQELFRPAPVPQEVSPRSVEDQLRQLRAMLRGLGATEEDVRLIMHVLRVRQEQIRQEQEGKRGAEG